MGKSRFAIFVVMFCLVLFVSRANGEEQAASGLGRAFAANEIIGVHVKDPQGHPLGRITDLVVDSGGRVALAVLSHGGFLRMNEKKTAIPFSALKYDSTAKQLILDSSKERLEAAPAFKLRELSAQREAEKIYRYFGLRPYWSEGGELFRGVDEPLEESTPQLEPFLYE